MANATIFNAKTAVWLPQTYQLINEVSGVNPYVDKAILQLFCQGPSPSLLRSEEQRAWIFTKTSHTHDYFAALASPRYAAAAVAASSVIPRWPAHCALAFKTTQT